jgi:PPOX class probable F420-dependent enzyme
VRETGAVTSEVERLGSGKYVLLTTFRRDGRAVPTPVWIARDGEELRTTSLTKAGKVKRIRNNGTVEVAACDVRGNPRGPMLKATARLLDAKGTDHTRTLLKRKYGLIAWISITGGILFRGRTGSIGIAITLG